MSNTLWNQIKQIDHAVIEHLPLDQSEVVLLPVPSLPWSPAPTFWLVGEYEPLAAFATSLRGNQTSRDFITEKNIRFGLRRLDCPALTFDRQEEYGARQIGPDASKSFLPERIQPVAAAAKPNKPTPINRRGDRDENVRLYWLTQTGQSHHIVEYNNLHTVGVSQPGSAAPLDHGRLPCVLLAAEFHQRYISSILKPTHSQSAAQLRTNMIGIYQGIYVTQCPPLAPLWQVSRAILRAAGFTVPTH